MTMGTQMINRPQVAAPPVVTDWTRDFDPVRPEWRNDPYNAWNAIRAAGGAARTTRYWRPMHFFTGYKAVRYIAYDPAGFSSGHLIPFRTLPAKAFRSPPMSSDPPDHRRVRQMLTPLFKQSALDSLAPVIRDSARELLEPIRTAREVDAATAYVQPLSTAVLSRFLGVDPADGPWLRAQAAAITNPASTEGFVEANEAIEFFLRQRLR
jgi:cytochrome P450